MRQVEEERQEENSHYSVQEVNQLVGELPERPLHLWWEQNPVTPWRNLFQAEPRETGIGSYGPREQQSRPGLYLGLLLLQLLQGSQLRLPLLW